ncbi:phosphate ABC transporter permease [Phormidesmis priestleyi]|uniref:phosphate ABC transporter permease n=1 Tax=Phormidesmis priestleyi TaxID=268141 RepID=UPI000934CAC7|nr:phosphate ABC transporter permease [Phormidesmis priestleyi]
MLIPLSRKKLEQLIPAVGTGAQYAYFWGNFSDFLLRVLISISALAVILLVSWLLPIGALRGLRFFLGLFALVYWLWRPVLQAGLKNREYRRYKYAGFLRGEVTDVYISDEVVGKEETVNDRGELVVVENRERKLNLIVEDESGFIEELQVPIKREHQAIAIGDTAEMVVLSNRPDLSRIAKVTDIFVPRCGVWVSDYPYLRRDEFESVSRKLDTNPEFNDLLDDDDQPRRRGEYDEPKPPRKKSGRTQNSASKNRRPRKTGRRSSSRRSVDY